MIRYNANDPMIRGRQQYDVLRGFGRWCVGLSVCFCILIIYALVFNSQARSFSLLKSCIVISILIGIMTKYLDFIKCLFLFGLYCLLTVFTMQWGGPSLGVFFDSRFGHPLFYDAVLFAVLYIVFTFGGIGFAILNWNVHLIGFMTYTRKTETYIIFVYFVVSVLSIGSIYFIDLMLISGMLAFLFILLRKVRRVLSEPHILFFLDNKLDYDDPNIDINEPNTVTVFESINPIISYAVIMFYFGSIAGILAAFSGLYFLLRDGDLHKLWVCLTIAMGGIVILACGYGLSKLQEWARMLVVIVHAFAILFLFGFSIEYLNPTILGLALYPVAHWCYFVVRTLTCPAVVYICFRGGQDIE